MITYVDYNFYITKYNGEIPKTQFDKLVIDASLFIEKNTFGRISDTSESVQYATCKIIDLLYEYENIKNNIGMLKSENVDGWSQSFKTDSELNEEFEKQSSKILKLYLSNIVGNDGNLLLYRGV